MLASSCHAAPSYRKSAAPRPSQAKPGQARPGGGAHMPGGSLTLETGVSSFMEPPAFSWMTSHRARASAAEQVFNKV